MAAAILAVMTELGIGKIVDSDTQRATVFGQNANRAARVLCAGLLAAIGLVYGRSQAGFRPAWLAWPIAALMGLVMIMGGSRGGLLALAVGLCMFSLTGKTIGIRLRNIVVAMLTIAAPERQPNLLSTAVLAELEQQLEELQRRERCWRRSSTGSRQRRDPIRFLVHV